ncbi:hypothetical protein [Kitasatospora sp. NPDC090308]|uniref:hypothetical protein n=1 Tax=Kitasatospora sp. NPDC090308 TaxID=3364082 RepID=UPI003822BEEB
MAIELPGEVVSFLSVIGIDRPTVHADEVGESAPHARGFAQGAGSSYRAAVSSG